MINSKYCQSCHDNYYNSPSTSGSVDAMCWNRKKGKIVWRIPVGMWENPPYKGKKKIRTPDCWHGIGNNRTIMVSPEALTSEGYWKG
jgi:hypothetical protein